MRSVRFVIRFCARRCCGTGAASPPDRVGRGRTRWGPALAGHPLEIASVADVPAGTGMGSSGAYTVCLLKGLAHARRTSITPSALAEAACEIEIDVLGE